MPYLISDNTTALKRRFPDVTTTDCELYTNLVNREVCSAIPEAVRRSMDITLTANDPDYVLSHDVLEVHSVFYYTDATTATKLTRTTLDELSAKKSTWVTDAAAAPDRYYVQNEQGSNPEAALEIWLYPKPPTTTSGGYPKVVAYVSECKSLTTSQKLPEGLATYAVYIEGASYYAAQDYRDQETAAGYLDKYSQLLEFCRKRWKVRLPDASEEATYPYKR